MEKYTFHQWEARKVKIEEELFVVNKLILSLQNQIPFSLSLVEDYLVRRKEALKNTLKG